MPRPRKIVQEESNISDVIEVQEELIYVQEKETIEPEVEISPVVNIISEPEVFAVKETLSPTTFKVYHLGNYVEDVQENSNQLNGYLELNKTQLYDNIDKLKTPTSDPEDLALFNIPATDNRKYNSLAQYYQQNGLAPQTPRINNWMTYYKIK